MQMRKILNENALQSRTKHKTFVFFSFVSFFESSSYTELIGMKNMAKAVEFEVHSWKLCLMNSFEWNSFSITDDCSG